MAIALGAGLVLTREGASPGFWVGAGTSSAHHGWATPVGILDALYGAVPEGFDLDPCSATTDRRTATVRARMHYSAKDDGLALPWRGRVYLNPPYGRELPRWVAKARTEVSEGRASLVLCLIPARTDTRWWHSNIVGQADMAMLRGRLSFGSGGQPAPFASAIVAWGCTDEQRTRLRGALPTAWWVLAAAKD